jgi:tellurite resistance protein
MGTRSDKVFLNQLNQQEKGIFLQLAILVIRADKKIEESEKLFIAEYAHEMDIPSYDLNSDVEAKSLCKTIGEISNYAIKRIFLVELMACANADGHFTMEEKLLIESMATDFGLTEQDLSECERLLERYISATAALTRFVKEVK